LFIDAFKQGNPLVAGTANTQRLTLNFGVADGDNVSMIAKPAAATAIDDEFWAQTVATGVKAALPTNKLTYKGVLSIKTKAEKARIRPIKVQKYKFVLYCSTENAENILGTVSNFQTQVSLAPEEIAVFGWTSFIVSQILVVGMPLMDAVSATDGTGGAFTSASTILDFGDTVANNSQIQVDDLMPVSEFSPVILAGEAACLTGLDWNMQLEENDAIAYKKITGSEWAMSSDYGFTNAQFVQLPKFGGGDVLANKYGGMRNFGSMTFLTAA
jgi:hypothetical protein